MEDIPIIFELFLIFSGAAILGILVLYFKQSLLIAYIALGLILGPACLQVDLLFSDFPHYLCINNAELINRVSKIGIIFLLFIVGLHLKPEKLISALKSELIIVLISSVCFFVMIFSLSYLFQYSLIQAVIIGMCLIFSSTIISLNLLPANKLDQHPIGEIMISILLLQDLLAIFFILILQSLKSHNVHTYLPFLKVFLSLPFLILLAYVSQKYILIALYKTFKKPSDFVFLLSIGWCLGVAELANYLGVSYELGALIAGLCLAEKKTSYSIAVHLKPVSNFFLILYFFSVGADFDINALPNIYKSAFVLAVVIIILKPLVFRALLIRHEKQEFSNEIAIRLGQASEFSIISSGIAHSLQLIDLNTLYLIQATTIITFILSPMITVKQYPEKKISLENI